MPSFPHYSQLNEMDCGPACLRMVAKYYGKHYSLQKLRELSFITREGVSLLGLSHAAEKIGMNCMGAKISINQLIEDAQLPCILHWNQNHFVVCYKIKRGKQLENTKFFIADPAKECLEYKIQDFKHCWISGNIENKSVGTVLLLQPSPSFFNMDDDNETTSKKDLFLYIKYLYPYSKYFVQLFVGLILGCLLQLIFPFLTQSLVDVGIGNRDLDFVTLILIAQISLFCTQLAITFVRSWIMLHINARIDISMISDFLMKLMSLPLDFFNARLTGDIMQRIEDHARIKSFLMNNSVNILFSLFSFIVFATILGYYNLIIFLIFILGNILHVVWIFLFMEYRKTLDTRRFLQAAHEQSKIIQIIQGIHEIKLNNCEREKRWEWEKIQVKLFKISVKALSVGQIQQAGSSFFTHITGIIISFIAAKEVIEGNMSLGMMMSLTYIIGQVTVPIQEFIGFAQSFQDAKLSMERLNEIHQIKDEEQELQGLINDFPKERLIKVENVSFSYSGAHDDCALKNLTLSIPENKVTALVGASGCGKTTLIKLLLGFYKPINGKIFVGETLLSTINPHSWRSKTGAVLQDGFIFSDTIANNIAISSDEIDKERMRHAIKVANINDFIQSLPAGLNTKIGMEGNGISAGQRQRILIARAVYKNPEFIFFDEATNALDSNNEHSIMQNLKTFYEGKTVVVAAHRLSTIKDADKIIVLNEGSLAEQGTHEDLIASKGLYYDLVKKQLDNN